MESLQLSQLPVMESLIKYLDTKSIKALGLLNKRIKDVKNEVVTHLKVDCQKQQSSIIIHWLSRYPNLKSLDMDVWVEEKLKFLPEYPKIRSLKLREYGMIHLEVKYLKNIEKLDFSESMYLDNIFPHLAKMYNLKYLDISNHRSPRYHKILNNLFEFTQLETLKMRDIPDKLPYTPFEKLFQCRHLKNLDFRGCHFVPGVKDIFNQCSHIKVLT